MGGNKKHARSNKNPDIRTAFVYRRAGSMERIRTLLKIGEIKDATRMGAGRGCKKKKGRRKATVKMQMCIIIYNSM